MERKIGETFEFEGKKFEVKAVEENICNGCFFNAECSDKSKKIIGECDGDFRDDGKNVIFVVVQEQPQKLNLCEILKYCPQGETFWSPMLGYVKMYEIDQEAKTVDVELENGDTWEINNDGTISIDEVTSPEVMLYPSREQRDWTKVKYEKKKELPRTWEEFCKNYPRKKKGDTYFDTDSGICFCLQDSENRDKVEDKNLLPSREAAEAHLAYMQPQAKKRRNNNNS